MAKLKRSQRMRGVSNFACSNRWRCWFWVFVRLARLKSRQAAKRYAVRLAMRSRDGFEFCMEMSIRFPWMREA